MKKLIALLLTLISLLVLAGCGGRGEKHTLEFTIPAGYTGAFTFSDKALDYDTFVYSAEEISPTRKTLTLKAGAGYSSVPVILKVIECREENAYEPMLLTHDKPVTINVEKGAWFQVGIALENPADIPIAASVIVEDVNVRIANTESIGATETTVDWSEIPGGKRFIVEIRDRAEEEHLDLVTSGCTHIDIIGTCGMNVWNGRVTPQIIIEDYEIVNKQEYYNIH